MTRWKRLTLSAELTDKHKKEGTFADRESDDNFHYYVFEFHGCMFHSCERCYEDREMPHPKRKTMTMAQIREETRVRDEYIEKHFEHVPHKTIVTAWECEVRHAINGSAKEVVDDDGKVVYPAKDKEMADFFKQCHDTSPIKNRDPLMGGKTQPFCMHAKADAENAIAYVDFDSLYPSVNYEGEYMTDHPEGITRYADVRWTKKEHIIDPKTNKPIKGFLKVLILPPKRLDLPVSFSENHRYSTFFFLDSSCPVRRAFAVLLMP